MLFKTLAYLLLILIILSRPDATFQYAYEGLYQWAAEFLDWLFECEFCMGAELYIREENTASRRAAEACGFSCEGEYKGYLKYRYVF